MNKQEEMSIRLEVQSIKKDIEHIMSLLKDLKALFTKSELSTLERFATERAENEKKFASKEGSKYVRILVMGFAGLIFVGVATEMIKDALN